jgi:prepilin-type N-terminal cleavage/methylation domain-containing protein
MCGQMKIRKGFTLVEILVAITVITILGGLLLAGLFPALRRAKEAAIIWEMSQIEMAIEQFHTNHQIYPPSFLQFHAIADNNLRRAEIKRFLNRISPNHSESDGRIDQWWLERGRFIDPRRGDDLVFWLSGLFKNKQFPLTGSANGDMPLAYSLEASGEDRNILYNFKPAQLFQFPLQGVASYSQEKDNLAPFVYIDAPNYLRNMAGPIGPVPERVFMGYWQRGQNDPTPDAMPTPMEIANGTVVFPNPTTFQLIVRGIDRQTGDGIEDIAASLRIVGRNVRRATLYDQDNLSNFANGRIDSYVNSISD